MSIQISPVELAELLKSPHPPRLLDVRQPDEFEFVALPGAKLIPLGELEMRVSELDEWRGEEIVVYCHHGVRSLHAIHRLRLMGFERLLNLSGGIDAWAGEVDASMPRY